MRVVEEAVTMLERDREEGWMEVAEEYEEMKGSEWGYEERMELEMEEMRGEEMGEEECVMKENYLEESMQEAATEEVVMAEDNRGMGVIEIVLIIVVLIGLVIVFRTAIGATLTDIVRRIGELVGEF